MITRDLRFRGNDRFLDKEVMNTQNFHLYGDDRFWDKKMITSQDDTRKAIPFKNSLKYEFLTKKITMTF